MALRSSLSTVGFALAVILLDPAAALADEMGGSSVEVPPPGQAARIVATPSAPADPPADDLCTKAVTYDPDRPWRYDTEYLFPLTRHMPCSGLPLAARIVMHPFAAVIDAFGFPAGVLAGLGGE